MLFLPLPVAPVHRKIALMLFEGAMNSLDDLEYQVFYDFYIKRKTGIACYVDLGITEGEFYSHKNKAIEKVALFLGCAVFEDNE